MFIIKTWSLSVLFNGSSCNGSIYLWSQRSIWQKIFETQELECLWENSHCVSFMQYGVTLKILNSEYSQSFYNSKYIASLLIDSNEPFYIFLFLWYFPNQVIRRNTKLWVAFCFEKVLNTAVYMILFLLQIQCGFRKTQYVDLFISGFKIDFKI